MQLTSRYLQQSKGRVSARRVIALASFALFFAACATPVQAPPPSPAEVARKERELGHELAQQFESQFRFKHDPEVEHYLESLASKLLKPMPELQGVGAPEIQLIESTSDGSTAGWHSYGLPGNHIYLSLKLIKELEFENELAAMLAFELAHLERRSAMKKLGETSPDAPQPELFTPGGLFDFPEDAQLEAAKRAVEVMYSSGYDPRGMVAIWRKYEEQPRRSPLPLETVKKLEQHSRSANALRAPLRNPIVRSEAFLQIQKKIKRL